LSTYLTQQQRDDYCWA
jgi:hypothetical protein